jgi:hypothetical protein
MSFTEEGFFSTESAARSSLSGETMLHGLDNASQRWPNPAEERKEWRSLASNGGWRSKPGNPRGSRFSWTMNCSLCSWISGGGWRQQAI